jgi:hypothetical protein
METMMEREPKMLIRDTRTLTTVMASLLSTSVGAMEQVLMLQKA